MEEQEAPVAPVLDEEMKEVMTMEREKEDSSQELMVTTVTTLTTVVDVTVGRIDVERKEEVETDKISEQVKEEKNVAEMEGGGEEDGHEGSKRKMSLGPWESEVSWSFCNF